MISHPAPDPPHLVATNTDAELARGRAIQDVSWAMREVAANLIRVVRGAGKPDDVLDHAVAFTKAMLAYRDAVGEWPSGYDLSTALSIRQDGERRRQLDDDELERLMATNQVVRGALQVAASRLLGQTTQERTGDDGMEDGVRRLEDLNAKLRRKPVARPAVVSKVRSKRVKPKS